MKPLSQINIFFKIFGPLVLFQYSLLAEATTATPKLVETSLESLGNISILIILLLTSTIGSYFIYEEERE